MTAVFDSVRVEHDDARHRFVGYVGDDALATLTYRRQDDVLDLLHTEVNPEARGRGIGDALVQHVLDGVRERGERVIATCPFVTAFIRAHREYADLVQSR